MRKKYSDGDSTRETDHNGVGNKFDNRSQFESPHQYEHDARQYGCNGKPFKSILFDNTINNNNKGAGRPSDLYGTPSEQGNQKTANNGRDNSLFGGHTRRNTKGNGQWQGNNTYNYPCH